MDEFVVGVDGSEQSKRALRWAASAAERTGVPLRIVEAWTYPALAVLQPAVASLGSAEEMDARTRDDLDAFVKDELGDVPQFATTQALRGPAAAAILQNVGPDSVLVLGARGRGGFAGLVLGSVSRECIEHAPCPVVIVQHERGVGAGCGPLVVGKDGSPNSARALDWALALRDHVGGEVVALYAWTAQVSEVRPKLRERLRNEARAKTASWEAGHDIRTVEVEGDPRAELISAANEMNASMLVVGLRGESRLRGLILGGVTAYVISESSTTVAVIPPPA